MARGLVLSPNGSSTLLLSSIARVSLSPSKRLINPFVPNHLRPWRRPIIPSHYFLYCNCSSRQDSIDMSEYKESFAKRMAMAGLKPHHRIALGVSGGPDSMALCVLATDWKMDGINATKGSNGFIDGILAIIVDHGLRAESKDEAQLVSLWVSDMDVRLLNAIGWMVGQNWATCKKQLVTRDDQAELFIIRLSRNSGVLGLAGMAFTSQLFSSYARQFDETSNNYGILLVRPLLDFSKEDMYKICLKSKREWVEDPTNQSQLFARNRIRMSLNNLSSCMFKSELQAVISSCRKTRLYVDQSCCGLINQAVIIMAQGYAVIDLEILKPSKVEDISLSKFIALVLQFISQRHKPVRGSTSKLLLDYIRTFPCKTSLTAAGCYLCATPGSKGTKVLVCCSVNSPPPSNMGLIYERPYGGQKQCMTSELEQIITIGKSYSEKFVPDASVVHFLDVTPECILSEAQKLNILSDSTYSNILLLQREEIKHFKSKNGYTSDCELKREVESVSSSLTEPLKPGQVFYFMKRFLVSWELRKETTNSMLGAEEDNCDEFLGGESVFHHCGSCVVTHDMVAEVRHMIDADWLYLADLSKCQDSEKRQQQRVLIAQKTDQSTERKILCSDYVKLSAQRALLSLKSIPVAARRGLPVLLNRQGLLLSIPSIGFKHCPCLKVSAVFKPTVPLGGGHSSFI